MITKEEDKQRARILFRKALADKRAINECIRMGKNIKTVADERGIKLAAPL